MASEYFPCIQRGEEKKSTKEMAFEYCCFFVLAIGKSFRGSLLGCGS